MKKNIGQKLALYPTPATVVGTVGEEGRVNWLLVAHVGIVSHSKLLLSIHSAHHSVEAIDATKRLSVKIIDEEYSSRCQPINICAQAMSSVTACRLEGLMVRL